jgi:hypothetical protein
MLILLASAATAQQATSPQQTAQDSDGAAIKVTSRLTLVDVTATDSKGKPVHGLVQTDFSVKEDGKPQAIRNFEEYGTEKPAAPAAVPQLPPDVYTNIQPPAPATSAVKTTAQYEEESHTFFTSHGAASSRQILFAVRETPSSLPAKPDDPPVIGQPDAALKVKLLVRYDFRYALPPDQITLSSDDNGKRKASMEFIMAAYDGEGKMLNVVTDKVSFVVLTDVGTMEIPVTVDKPKK